MGAVHIQCYIKASHIIACIAQMHLRHFVKGRRDIVRRGQLLRLPTLCCDKGRPVGKVPVQRSGVGEQARADLPAGAAHAFDALKITPVGVVTYAVEIQRKYKVAKSCGAMGPALRMIKVIIPALGACYAVVRHHVQVHLTTIAVFEITKLPIHIQSAFATQIGCKRGIAIWRNIEIVRLAKFCTTGAAKANHGWQKTGAPCIRKRESKTRHRNNGHTAKNQRPVFYIALILLRIQNNFLALDVPVRLPVGISLPWLGFTGGVNSVRNHTVIPIQKIHPARCTLPTSS